DAGPPARAVPAVELAVGRPGLHPLPGGPGPLAGLVSPRRPRASGGRADRARGEPLALHLAARGARRGAGSLGTLTVPVRGPSRDRGPMLRCSRPSADAA